MKLFLISQTLNDGCDTYSDAVVAALDKEAAILIHPDGSAVWVSDKGWCYRKPDGTLHERYWFVSWVAPSAVSAKYIGEAAQDIEQGVVCASFHAG